MGKFDKSCLSRFHHTKQYVQDFPLIEKLVEYFARIYTTPNVLTEISNLSKDLGVNFFDVLQRVVQVLDEQYCASSDAVSNGEFRRLGLTDSGLLNVAKNHLVVTTDFNLYQTLRSKKIDAVNFSHLRSFADRF